MDCKHDIYDKCRDGISGYAYMLKDPLWHKLAKKTKGRGLLCWSCAQHRHGTAFVFNDLLPCPCSYRRLLVLSLTGLPSVRARRLLRRGRSEAVALMCGIVKRG